MISYQPLGIIYRGRSIAACTVRAESSSLMLNVVYMMSRDLDRKKKKEKTFRMFE